MDTLPNILIVDDQPDFLDLVSLILDAAGYHPLLAYDGVEAINILQGESIDLILADIGMPKLNGYQLLQQVRQHPVWTTIPFIFISARSLNSDVQYGLQLGVPQYLTKPIRAGELLSAVQNQIGLVYA